MMRVINKKSEVEKNQLNNTKTNESNDSNINQRFNSSNSNRVYSKELRSNINVTALLTESKIPQRFNE